MRTDVANIYRQELPRTRFSRVIAEPVEQVPRLNTACVVVNLLRIPGQPESRDKFPCWCVATAKHPNLKFSLARRN